MKDIACKDRTYRLYTSTIDTIQNRYMKNCQLEYIEHWQLQVKKYYAWLLRYQLENFDYE